jgi:hypothetical protein
VMCVPNGELSMICEPTGLIYFSILLCIGAAYLGNMVVEPFGAQCPISTSVVPIVVARHVLQDIMHS